MDPQYPSELSQRPGVNFHCWASLASQHSNDTSAETQQQVRQEILTDHKAQLTGCWHWNAPSNPLQTHKHAQKNHVVNNQCGADRVCVSRTVLRFDSKSSFSIRCPLNSKEASYIMLIEFSRMCLKAIFKLYRRPICNENIYWVRSPQWKYCIHTQTCMVTHIWKTDLASGYTNQDKGEREMHRKG